MTRLRWVGFAPFVAGLLALAGGSLSAQDAKMKFELYKGKDDTFRWRLVAGKEDILATGGQGYKDKADAKNGIEIVQRSGKDDKLKYEFYEDEKKEHRWRLKAANGQVVASSSKSYKAKADAEKAVDNIKMNAAKAEVVEVKE